MTSSSERGAATDAARTDAARAFGEVVHAVGDDPRPDVLLAAAARMLLRTTGMERCGVYLREPTTRRFRGRLGVPSDIDETVRRLVVGGRSDEVTSELISTARPVFVADARSDARMALAAPRAWNTASLLGVPMIDEDRVTGLFLLDGARRAQGVDAAMLEQVGTFGTLVGRWAGRTRRSAQLPSALRELEQERRAANGLHRIQPRLSALARGPFNDGAVLRVLADQLGREILRIGPTGGVEHRERPRGADGPPVALEPATIRALRAATADLGAGAVRVVEPSLERGLRRRWVVAPVVADEEPRGLVAVAEVGTPIARLDVELVRRVADLLGIGIERTDADRRQGTDHRHMRAADRLGIVPRTGRTSAPGERPPLLIAFVGAPGDAARSAETTLRLEERLLDRPGGRDGVVLRTDDGLVVVVPAPAGGDPGELRSALLELAPGTGLGDAWIGIVRTEAEEMDLGPALEEARRFAEWGRDRPGAPSIVTAADLGPARLLLTPRARAGQLAREVLGPLLEDDPGMADLLTTVGTFFATGRSVRASSVRLGVHENTIRYRFNRIRQLTGHDVVGDADTQLLVQSALVALEGGVRTDRPAPGDG
ncbi:helix-turn-helix domain-containing protein [Patulibacter minatonensis]|uniref:helix-turn-helix domain-containing protein n=1 Tax=Patulibacter minatonensis TaxID=298163 RepID=UPI00047ADCB8|nr:GAF domain-containing protein [Patulibacter minatonensis]